MINPDWITRGIALAPALTAGFALGSLYFAALWWTVRQLPETEKPAQLFLGSFIGRIGIILAGFYFVMDGHWERMLACIIGFTIARSLLVNRLRPKPFHQDVLNEH
jgi:F1F0 ATPase subunit 2